MAFPLEYLYVFNELQVNQEEYEVAPPSAPPPATTSSASPAPQTGSRRMWPPTPRWFPLPPPHLLFPLTTSSPPLPPHHLLVLLTSSSPHPHLELLGVLPQRREVPPGQLQRALGIHAGGRSWAWGFMPGTWYLVPDTWYLAPDSSTLFLIFLPVI